MLITALIMLITADLLALNTLTFISDAELFWKVMFEPSLKLAYSFSMSMICYT